MIVSFFSHQGAFEGIYVTNGLLSKPPEIHTCIYVFVSLLSVQFVAKGEQTRDLGSPELFNCPDYYMINVILRVSYDAHIEILFLSSCLSK